MASTVDPVVVGICVNFSFFIPDRIHQATLWFCRPPRAAPLAGVHSRERADSVQLVVHRRSVQHQRT